MNNLLRGRRGILIILAILAVIALAIVARGFATGGDTDNDEDQGVAGGVFTQVA
jgi:hypothetical protein